MPTISKKGRRMPASPIRKLSHFADDAEKRGVEVFQLNIGQPDVKSPQRAIDAVKNNTIDVLAYTSSEGSEEYRTKLANYLGTHNIDVTAKDIIVTTGGSEALLFALGCITDPGDEIIISEPFYANYIAFANFADMKIVPITSKIEDNFALPSTAEFEKLITPKTKAILICNPGNPTGYLYTKEEMEQLAALVIKHDLYLIADEVYREFVYDGLNHQSVLHNFGLENHAILIDSVSKRYSMCGARIGCLVSKNKEVISTALKFAQARLSPPTYSLIAADAALDTPSSYFDDIIIEYKSRRDALIAELQKIEGVKVSMPKGAFYCVAALPVDNADTFAQWLLEEYSLNNQTVFVAPAAGFYTTEGLGINEVRIAYVLKKEDLITAAKILKAAITAYNAR